MAPSSIKLAYFNGRGRAEQIRWILVQAGAKWEDKRIEQADWPAVKSTTPLGSLPYLEVDGKTVGTSGAIALYLAKEHGLMGSNNLEAAQVHMFWECTQDAFNASAKLLFMQDADEKAKASKEYYTVTLPKLIKLMAPRMQGGNKWLVGDKVTMADLVTACLMEGLKDGDGLAALNAEPLVAKHVARVLDLPNIKKWIANRPVTPF